MTTLQQPGQASGRSSDPTSAGPDRRAWSYGPGGWYAALGPDAGVLLPPGQRARATALWAAVDDGAAFDTLLDALLAEGLRDLPGFVLAAVDGDAVRVLVRGEASVACETDDGPVAVDGRDAATWSERRLVGVRSTRIVLGGPAPGAGAREEEAGESAAGSGPVARVVGTALVRVAWVAHPAEAPAGAAPPVAGPEVPPAPGPAPEPDPGPAPEPDPDPLGGDLVGRLVLSTGESVEVDRVVLLGRDPEARPGLDPAVAPGREPGEPRLVRLPSPQHEISSTHLEVRPGTGVDRGSVVATDLGSTNGTIVVQPGRRPADLQPWAPLPLAPGSVLDLGDGLTVQVATGP